MSDIVEYPPGDEFPGVIGRTVQESSPAWPAPLRAKDGAPNVLFFVLDDVGYGQLSCFGGLVETPNIDRVAASGLRYANMHTTALCSPTRACIMTGRNHHSSGVACIMELATGYPGYDGRMPLENGMLAEMLLPHGYNTFCLGKWHLSPSEENTPAGPLHRWPLGRGFERFYGFLGGETNQWYPDLTLDNGPATQPKGPEDGYHLSEDLADQAIKFVVDAHVNAPEKPFFLYYAPGRRARAAPRAARVGRPLRGQVRRRLGRLPRDRVRAPAGDRAASGRTSSSRRATRTSRSGRPLSADERRLYARMMEVYAGFVSHADHHFGRVLDMLERIGELDNTLIMIISDNGASAEGGVTGSFNEMRFFNQVPESFEDNLAHIDELGGPTAYNHYPWGWAWAGDTPFRRWKRETYRGGSTDPFILAWPAGIAGARRAAHAVRARDRHGPDRARRARPRAAGSDPRRRADAARGRQLRAHLRRARGGRPSTSRSTSRCSATARSTTTAGAPCARGRGPTSPTAAKLGRKFGDPITPEVLEELDRSGWELYDMAGRPDRGAQRRRRAPRPAPRAGRALVGGGREVQGAAARRVGAGAARDAAPADLQAADALRLLPRRLGRAGVRGAAGLQPRRTRSRPTSRSRPSGAEGVLVAQGGDAGGYSFYLKDGELRFIYNYVGLDHFEVRRDARVPPRAATRCATSSSRPASRTSPTARAPRAAASSTSTARSSPRATSRTPRRCSSSSRD